MLFMRPKTLNTSTQIRQKYILENYYPTLDSKVFKDRINLDLASLIYDNIDHIILKEEVQQLKTRLNNIITNNKLGLSNTYNYAWKNLRTNQYQGFENGRLFSSTSIQGLQREIRNAIIDRENCLDVDMTNCHPCVLNQVTLLLNVNAPTLNNYVTNRDSLLSEIEAEYKLKRDESKTIPLAVINGGIRSTTYSKITWLKTLEDEIKLIYDALIQTQIGQRIVSHIKTVNKTNDSDQLIHSNGRVINLMGSTINLLLCKIENEILTQCVLFFKSKDVEVYTLCFDGLIIAKDKAINKLISGKNGLETHIYKTLGLEIQFKVKQFESSIDTTNLTNKHLHYDDTIMNIDFSNDGITFISANMAYGKTTQLYNYIERKCDSTIRVLILTPRKSLAKEFYHKFKPLGFEHYLHENAFKSKKLICQIDSIYKVRGVFDICILDEVETILHHIVAYDKMKEKDQILFKLESIVQLSKQIFVMDANLSSETKLLFKHNFKYHQTTDLKFTYRTFNGRPCKFIVGNNFYSTRNQHGEYVIKCLKEGKNVACPVSSLNYLKDLSETVKIQMPDCKMLTISSQHPFESVDVFINYNLVIYTSVLLCGNNFNQKHFDIIVPYISNTHSSAKLYSQQMLRIRQFSSIVIFIYFCNYAKNNVSKSQILTRWKYDYNECIKNGIKYNDGLDQFKEDFYFQLMLNQTIEIENASSNLLNDLMNILTSHGFIISGEQIIEDDHDFKLVKYDKKEDFIKIIEAETMTFDKLNAHTYSSHEYYKYIIEKTFDISLNKSMIEFVSEVHSKISNHNNYMILRKYGIDKTIQIHHAMQVSKSAEYKIFIPKSKEQLTHLFLHKKSLEFIKKYNVIQYVNTDQIFIINNDEFIKWYGLKRVKDIALVIPKTINTLLKIHGLYLKSMRIRDNGRRKRNYVIVTFIDYNKFNIKLDELISQEFYNLDYHLHNLKV